MTTPANPALLQTLTAETELDDEEVLTGPQTAEILKVHLQTVQALARRGELRAAKVGKAYRFKRRWISEYLENCADAAVCG